MLARRPLYDFQRDVYYYTGRVQHPAMLLQMRLGKTIITTRRILRTFPNTSGILIVAPTCALDAWEQELLKENVPQNEICYLTGTRTERFHRLCNRTAFSLINREGFRALPEIATHNWDAVICDESTFLKNPKAQVTKFFCENFRTVPQRWILSGLIAPECDLEIFQQLYFLDPTILGMKSYWQFRFQFFEQIRPYKWSITSEGKVWLRERMRQSCYVLSRKDVHMDVKKVYERRVVELPPAIRKAYDTAEKQFVLELNGVMVDKTVYAMEKFIWLNRICGGLMKGGEVVHDKKVGVLLDLLAGELVGEQVVVWCNFIEEITHVDKVLTNMQIPHSTIYGAIPSGERVRRIRDFVSGRCLVLLGQPGCFKYSVDLSCSDTEIYFSSPPGAETRQQSEDRLVSIHTGRAILIIDIIVRNSVDEDNYTSLQLKETRQQLLDRIIKRRRKSHAY
jgi:SNF2 family DNA or RNA helicase